MKRNGGSHLIVFDKKFTLCKIFVGGCVRDMNIHILKSKFIGYRKRGKGWTIFLDISLWEIWKSL